MSASRDPQQLLSEKIATTEQQLNKLRERRDIQIRKQHELGMSKYRIAKQWGLSENTVTRVLARGE